MTQLMRYVRGFRAAMVFLTIVPLPSRDLTRDDFTRASIWFPTVGLLLGALLALAHAGLTRTAPASVGAVLLLVVWTVFTGGLHLDGFIDVADALPATVSPARRLEIMKDVHVGAYGTVATALLFLLQWSALRTLWHHPLAPAGLVLAPVAGRAMIVWGQAGWPYAPAEGLGHLVPSGPFARTIALSWLAGAALVGGWATIGAAGATVVGGHLFAAWSANRLGGGLTGDVYGALCVLAETGVLLVLATLAWNVPA